MVDWERLTVSAYPGSSGLVGAVLVVRRPAVEAVAAHRDASITHADGEVPPEELRPLGWRVPVAPGTMADTMSSTGRRLARDLRAKSGLRSGMGLSGRRRPPSIPPRRPSAGRALPAADPLKTRHRGRRQLGPAPGPPCPGGHQGSSILSVPLPGIHMDSVSSAIPGGRSETLGATRLSNHTMEVVGSFVPLGLQRAS